MARAGSPDGHEFTTPAEEVALVALQVMTSEDKEAKSRSLAPPQHAQDRRASGTPGYSRAQKMRANFLGMTAWGGAAETYPPRQSGCRLEDGAIKTDGTTKRRRRSA